MTELARNNGLNIAYAVITGIEKEDPNRGELYGGLVIENIFYETAITDAVIVARGTGKEIRIGKHTLDEVTELYRVELDKKTNIYAPTEAPDDYLMFR